MPDFRYVGDHPAEAVVGENRPWLAPGDFVTFEAADLEDEQNKLLVADLVPLEASASDDTPNNADADAEVTSETTGETPTGSEGGE